MVQYEVKKGLQMRVKKGFEKCTKWAKWVLVESTVK